MCDRARPMHDAIKRARNSMLDLSPSPLYVLKESCPFYHIKVLCNARCGRTGDHHPYPDGADRSLLKLSNKAIPGGKGDGGGVK